MGDERLGGSTMQWSMRDRFRVFKDFKKDCITIKSSPPILEIYINNLAIIRDFHILLLLIGVFSGRDS